MAKPGKITQLDNDYTKRVRQSHQKKTVLTARRKKTGADNWWLFF
ncbi:hypothetical protein [Secundilactobacillus kimchicus]|nr:hypothetical protein [Secundilactobacillus kimchicus]